MMLEMEDIMNSIKEKQSKNMTNNEGLN